MKGGGLKRWSRYRRTKIQGVKGKKEMYQRKAESQRGLVQKGRLYQHGAESQKVISTEGEIVPARS